VGISGLVAGTGVMPVTEEDDSGFVDLAAPRAEFAVWVPFGAAVSDALAAQVAERGGEAAGFGEKVPTAPELVRPAVVAEIPCGFDHAAGVGRAALRSSRISEAERRR
jgi:hypothetical protein